MSSTNVLCYIENAIVLHKAKVLLFGIYKDDFPPVLTKRSICMSKGYNHEWLIMRLVSSITLHPFNVKDQTFFHIPILPHSILQVEVGFTLTFQDILFELWVICLLLKSPRGPHKHEPRCPADCPTVGVVHGLHL